MDTRVRELSIILCDHPRSRVLRDQQNVVTTLLRQMGYDVVEVQDGPVDVTGTAIIWVMGNVNWYPGLRRQLETNPGIKRPFVVIWHHEPLPPSTSEGVPWPSLTLREVMTIFVKYRLATDIFTNYFTLRSLAGQAIPDLLIVSSLSRQSFLAEKGIGSYFVPLGYNPLHGYDMSLQRDIDVLFLDALHFRRRRRAVRRLRRRGISLLILGSWTNRGFWGEDRTELLNRTRIFLNIHKTHSEMNANRLILGMANKALVISEPIFQSSPFIPGKHFISATLEQMPDAIDYYLSNEDERAHIANEGHRLVTQEVTMAHSVSRILELINERVNQPHAVTSEMLEQ